MTAGVVDEVDISDRASGLRMHAKFLADEIEEAAKALEHASKELEILRDVQWIVNRSTMETGPGTAEEALGNAYQLVSVAEEYIAWREVQGSTPGNTFHNQMCIADWIKSVLGEESASNGPERSLRLAEEALELTQALGVDKEALHKLVDYVYERPRGTPSQEIAGCQVTLYGVAAALGVSVQEVFNAELIRISQPEVMDRVQRRQAEKRAATGTSK